MQEQAVQAPIGHRRKLSAVVRAALRPRSYRNVATMLTTCGRPVDFLSRYLSHGGRYPAAIRVATPTGPVTIDAFSSDDIQTINEIFFRLDYETGCAARVVVDFGSNIGISALYFLTRRADAFVYCFEPLARNAERLRANLRDFSGRYSLEEVAVGEQDGTVRFGWEETGRYGGIGLDTGRSIAVPCRDSNAILRAVVERHGRIDVLKIDIETLEEAVTERIPADLLARIETLVVEYPFARNPLAATHDWERRNVVTAFRRRAT